MACVDVDQVLGWSAFNGLFVGALFINSSLCGITGALKCSVLATSRAWWLVLVDHLTSCHQHSAPAALMCSLVLIYFVPVATCHKMLEHCGMEYMR
jgi:hypothetical protein